MANKNSLEDDEVEGFLPLGASQPPTKLTVFIVALFLAVVVFLGALGVVEVSSPIDRWMPDDWAAKNKVYCKENPEVLRCRGVSRVSGN